MSTDSPFANPKIVERYEEWYSSPFGIVADRIESALLLELLHPLAAGASLLEIGCGTGHFAHALAKTGFRIAGVDPELAMLAVARKRIAVVCGDGQRLPFQNGAFDGAVLVAVLEFASDPVTLLREARRVARTRVVVLTLAGRSWLALRRRFSGWLGHPIFSRARFQSRARILATARAAGAEPDRVRAVLVLPPSIAGRLPRLEERLSRGALPCAGIVGLSLPGGT